MSAAAPEAPPQELAHTTAPYLFLTAGHEAACGFPLPDGSLPVFGKGLGGMRLMSAAEWQEYRDLCAGERLAFA